MMDKPLQLSENFYISNKKKQNVKIQVKLDEAGIYLRRETEDEGHINEQLIKIEDIVGSRCGPRLNKRTRGGLNSCRRLTDEEANGAGNSNQKDTSAYLYIYAYVKKDKPVRRDRTVRILRFRSSDKFEENLQAAECWYFAIRIHKNQKLTDISVKHSNTRNMDQRQLLILLNPKSGSGKGRELFQKQVVPVLQEAEVQYELHVTKYANFAREFVRTRQDLLERYRGIIVAAGDGLFYEVLNGIMEREDWHRICQQMPLGIIPCGSGNGLAKSISHLYDEPYETKPIIYSTLSCVSGNSALMDVVRIEVARNGKQTEMYSFLSVGWGLIADIDIGSERLRSIGTQRFTIWSIHRVISLRTYKGKLYYLPWQKEHFEQSMKRFSTQKTTTVKSAKSGNENGLVPKRFSITQGEFHDAVDIADDNEQTDEFADVISLDRQSFRPHTDSWHSATSNRTAYYSMAGQSMRSQLSMASRIESANASYSVRPLQPTIPSLNMPLPLDTWRCIEGEFVMVHAAYTTHLAADCYFAPDSRLNDGIIYLIIILAGVGRSQLVNFLLSLSSGTHLPEQENEYIKVVPVSAFRIEPDSDSEGIIAVDGESVDYGAIQGEIFPGMIRVMVPK